MMVGVGQVGQDVGVTGLFTSRLPHPAPTHTGVRQAGSCLNRLTEMVARLPHPYPPVYEVNRCGRGRLTSLRVQDHNNRRTSF